MNPRTTLLLAIVAALLGAFVYFYEIAGQTKREAVLQGEKNIHSGLADEDVEALSLVTLDGVEARFERREGIWFVVEPVFGRADATALDAMANALVSLPREGTVGAVDDLAGFGLGADAQTIRFETPSGTRGIRVGGTTPVGGHRYVARLADDEVAYVASYRVNAFARNLADLRERRIFGFEEGDVTTLRIAWPDAAGGPGSRVPDETRETSNEPGAGSSGGGPGRVEVALARAEEGTWHLGAPMIGMADQETVREIVSNLAYLRTEEFVDEPDQAIEAALEQTALSLHWTIGEEHLERHARIAGEVDGRRVFESDGGRVDLVSPARLDEVPRRLVAYRFRRLSDFEVSEARWVEMQFAQTGATGTSEALGVSATLEEAGWRGEDSAGQAIDQDRVSQWVRDLSELGADDIFAEEMGPRELASLGLDPPRARIEVVGASQPEARATTLSSLRIGRHAPGRGVFVQRSDSPTIFVIDAGGLGSIPISAEAYSASLQAEESEIEGALEQGGSDGNAQTADPLEGIELP